MIPLKSLDELDFSHTGINVPGLRVLGGIGNWKAVFASSPLDTKSDWDDGISLGTPAAVP